MTEAADNKVKEVSQETDVPEEVKKRISTLAEALASLSFIRTFTIRKGWEFMVEHLLTVLSGLFGDVLENPTIMNSSHHGRSSIDVEHSYRTGTWIAKFNIRETIGHCIGLEDKLNALYLERHSIFEGEILQDGAWKINSILTALKSEKRPPGPFISSPSSWRILDWKNNDIDQAFASPQMRHIADLLVALSINRNVGTNAVDAAMKQLLEFLETGDIKLNKVDNIDLQDPSTWPGRFISLGDHQDGLVWKYGKYCIKCGDKIAWCRCLPVGEEEKIIYHPGCSKLKDAKNPQDIYDTCEVCIEETEIPDGEITSCPVLKASEGEIEERIVVNNPMLVDQCWDCTRELVDHYLTGEFSENFTEETCKAAYHDTLDYVLESICSELPNDIPDPVERQAILEKWMKNYGAFFDMDQAYSNVSLGEETEKEVVSYSMAIKKLDKAQLKAFWSFVQDFESDGDFEDPEDSCSCPIW